MSNFTSADRLAELDNIYRAFNVLTIGDFQNEFHFHDRWEIYLHLNGTINYYIEGRLYTPAAGELLLIPAGILHHTQLKSITKPYEYYVLSLVDNYLSKLTLGAETLSTIFLRYIKKNAHLISFSGKELTLLQSLLDGLVNDKLAPEFREALLRTLVYQIEKNLHESSPDKPSYDENHLIAVIIQYIDDHYQENLSLDTICSQLFISKPFLTRYFKKYTGLTVYDYILTKRIVLAQQLLQEGVSAHKVAEKCGFSDYSNFYRVFTAKTGSTPKAFRHEQS